MQKSRDYFYFERKAEGKRILPWRPSRPLRENFTEWVSRQGRNERNEELPILPWRPLRPLRENFTEWVSRQGRNERNEELPIPLGDLRARCVKISATSNQQPATSN